MNLVELRAGLRRFWPALLWLTWMVGCTGGGPELDGGSETHFLSRCSGGCGSGLQCLCGVCTRSCAQETACSGLSSGTTCLSTRARVADGRCLGEEPPLVCDLSCVSDADCRVLSHGSRCDVGFCRRTADTGSVGEGEFSCNPPDPIAASDLAVLGDSLIQLSPFVSSLEELAQASGALAAGEHYRSYASAETSFLARNNFSIAAQYAASLASGAARVVVMNGGATDMLQNACGDAPSADCAAVRAAVSGAEQLIAEMAAGGVEHVVYMFYPDPRDVPLLEAGLNVLRPLIRNVCGKSPIPCHWVDLRPSFAGHDDYQAADGIVFSAAGAQAAANAVWELMDRRCVPR